MKQSTGTPSEFMKKVEEVYKATEEVKDIYKIMEMLPQYTKQPEPIPKVWIRVVSHESDLTDNKNARDNA